MTRAARILLVDDEVSIQRAVVPLLRSRGYEVETVATGSDALKSVAGHPPDLVVLDLGLPDLEGTAVCRSIREGSPVPIIVLSARGGEADKVSALDLGADDYVTKPFSPEELLARIRVALRRVFAKDGDEGDVGRPADLYLDTLPFNGGASASDALWAALPVVTTVGEAFASRMAGSLLSTLGLSELATNSLEGYERVATELAMDSQRRATYRQRLLVGRGTAPLFDGRRFCRHLELAYRAMWERSQRGEPPATFTVEPLAWAKS